MLSNLISNILTLFLKKKEIIFVHGSVDSTKDSVPSKQLEQVIQIENNTVKDWPEQTSWLFTMLAEGVLKLNIDRVFINFFHGPTRSCSP